MSRKKAFKEDIKLPDTELLRKYLLQYYKGKFYQKTLKRNLHVQFGYGYMYAIPKPYPLVCHREFELVYIRQGRGAYYLAGKTYSFQKRLLLIAKPNEVHALLSVSLKEKVERGLLIFPLGWLGLDLDIKSWPHEVLLNEEEAARLELICGQVSEEVKKQGVGYEDIIRIKFQEFCCLVRRIVSQPKKKRANPLVDQLQEYIDQHFAENISIKDISRNFGYTEQYLVREFKRSIGVSMKRYFLQRRVMEARLLLQTRPELKTTVIAEQVGFSEYQMFYRIFKILVGTTPEQYRGLIKHVVIAQ